MLPIDSSDHIFLDNKILSYSLRYFRNLLLIPYYQSVVNDNFNLFCFIDGKCLACTYRAKFVEVSVGIHHNVDELLAGTLTQIRLKKEQNALQVSIQIEMNK